ncbi:MAG TPA: signal peptidase II [Steroidobacteraceae bacterium]|nr:signal peptidase II [Steroidobacteraceae bacterium]
MIRRLMRFCTRTLLIALILVGCVGCDQTSKVLVRDYLPLGEPYRLAGNVFQVVHAENPGAFLSLGAGWPSGARSAAFIIGAAVIVAALLVWAIRASRLAFMHRIGLTLFAAGGFSNLLDRLFHGGLVTDFLYLQAGPLHTGIFNLADLVLVAGVVCLLWPRFQARP